MWKYNGERRPPFAIAPKSGQESVWDYPRPPRIVDDSRLVEVSVGDRCIARSHQTKRVLETASPPTFYIPPGDVDFTLLKPFAHSTYCEWKGSAEYFSLDQQNAVAWRYPQPTSAFSVITGWISFYASAAICQVDGELVDPQAGNFYGGWVTAEIVGPFKGGAGAGHW